MNLRGSPGIGMLFVAAVGFVVILPLVLMFLVLSDIQERIVTIFRRVIARPRSVVVNTKVK